MQIVIDIPEKTWDFIKKNGAVLSTGKTMMENEVDNALRNGVVIPKGHGRLIDADLLWDKLSTYTDNEGAKMPFGYDDSLIHKDSAMFIVENSPTIIEAEGESENDKI